MAAPGECGVPRVLSTKNLLTLSQQIGNKWEALAIVLGFLPAEIETFRANRQGDQAAQIRNMLTEWVQRKAGNPKIVHMLVEAFRDSTVNLNTVANELEKAAKNDVDVVPMLVD